MESEIGFGVHFSKTDISGRIRTASEQTPTSHDGIDLPRRGCARPMPGPAPGRRRPEVRDRARAGPGRNFYPPKTAITWDQRSLAATLWPLKKHPIRPHSGPHSDPIRPHSDVKCPIRDNRRRVYL